MESPIDELVTPERTLKNRIKQLEAVIAKQHEHIDRLHSAKFTIPKGKRTRTRGSYYRVAIPDTHGSKCDKQAIAALIADLEVIRPQETVFLGDHIDCGGFLAQHHTLGYVAECDYTFEEDIVAANEFLDLATKATPGSDYHYVQGNHERRIETYCVTMALRGGVDARFLYSKLSPDILLHLEGRNIQHYRLSDKLEGVSIPGTVKLGHCYFTHGHRAGANATRDILNDFSSCVVHGHTHTTTSVSRRTVHHGGIGAWCPGCLCELQPMWKHSAPTNWSHGYGLQIVRPDGGFLHINVPIIDGKSYLSDLVDPILKRKK